MPSSYPAYAGRPTRIAPKRRRRASAGRGDDVVQRHLREDEDEPGLDSARELLARSYFHSAQLARAAATAREVLARRPTDAYMAHLLTRSLERSARRDEADAVRPLARALGAEIT